MGEDWKIKKKLIWNHTILGTMNKDKEVLTKASNDWDNLISSEIEKAREEERVNMLDNMVQYLRDTRNLTLMFNPMSELTRAKQEWEVKIYEHLIENFSKLKDSK